MDDIKALYVEAVQLLVKSEGNPTPRGFIRSVHGLHDKYEAKALKAMTRIRKVSRRKFLAKFKPAFVERIQALKKADSEADIKAEIRKVLESSFAGASSMLTDELDGMIDDIAQSFSSAYAVDLNIKLVNQQATDYLRTHADNYFTTLADAQADGVYSAIADAMDNPDGYTIGDIVDGIRSAYGATTMYFDTQDGSRELDADAWSLAVARTETARAASFAQRATLEDLGLKTWQWQVQETGCDICSQNDDEVVAIGEAFSSGDTESPAHANCRCICIAVMDELTASQDDSEEEPVDE